ncbi:hypothetical protein [Nonomuraea ceibae]|uniref:hypothetical protein n=1 Tax=Nonomuraea ceibae TaxID=1935170 RepID=UPI001C5DD5B9|nr:hypothetical protein [Nonomuraea ceibae]
METTRVELHGWPHNHGPGGWVAPHGDPVSRWHVTRVYARYVAPEIKPGQRRPDGRPLKRRFEMRAYLVDLDGQPMELPDYERVLVHQVPPVGWWMIKPVDDDYLEGIEKYRQE